MPHICSKDKTGALALGCLLLVTNTKRAFVHKLLLIQRAVRTSILENCKLYRGAPLLHLTYNMRDRETLDANNCREICY